ncbi:uncharacterized protein [Brachyistius frenatus]|uniref:uncharacterized protein n=1 Tax=Brachyistius frenatus TaxID=100188 RepID=UPI0037E80E52
MIFRSPLGPYLEIFLGILGFGLSIMICTTFCRVCIRFRETQLEREARPRSIYVIPFPRNLAQDDSENQHGGEVHAPPRYSTSVYSGPPPSYNEVEIKPDDLPPAYTEYNLPEYLPPPTFHTDMQQSQSHP